MDGAEFKTWSHPKNQGLGVWMRCKMTSVTGLIMSSKSKIVRGKGAFVVLNDKGLHTRPSTELVKCATHFNSQIQLFYRSHVVNAKSLLGILMLAAERGARIRIEAVGEDAEEAILALQKLAKNRFNISY